LFGKGLGSGFELADEWSEIKSETGLAAAGCLGLIGAADCGNWSPFGRQFEMGPKSEAKRVTGNQLSASPMQNAAKTRAFAQLEQNLGQILGGARLAILVGIKPGGVTGGPISEQTFVSAAATAGTVAH
jgi:hypothetical protein